MPDPGHLHYRPNRFEKISDGILSVFSPKAALRNTIFREQRHALGYDAARITRERRNATRAGTITSNTPLNSADRVQMVWEARDLAMNDDFIHGLLDKIADYVVGPKLRIHVSAPDKGDNAQIEDWLYECMENCDLARRVNYTAYSRLSLIAMLRDGDVGHGYVVAPNLVKGGLSAAESYLKLRFIEGDTIGGYHYWIENNVVSGVEYDKDTGAAVTFRVYPRNPYGYYESNFTPVSADQMIFWAYRQRHDQFRGISAFATAIQTARDLHEILENEKIGVKWANAWAGFVKVATGSADFNDPAQIYQPMMVNGTPGEPPTGQRTPIYYENFHPGQIGYLAPGEEIQPADTNRPSPVFQGFTALLIRKICAAINVPFGFAFDATSLRGTGARLESAQAKRTFERMQADQAEVQHIPYFRRCIAHGIMAGRLKLAKMGIPNIDVVVPAHPTVDVGRESAANVSEYESGLKTFGSICEEEGKDPVEEATRMADESEMMINLAKQRGIPLELVFPPKKPQATKAPSNPSGGGGSQGSGGGPAAGIGNI